MVALPGAAAVTLPSGAIGSTSVLELVHSMAAPSTCRLLASFTWAVRVTRVPATVSVVAGELMSIAAGTWATFTVTWSLLPPAAAVMIAVPLPIAVTVPLALTVATPTALLFQLMVVLSAAPSELRAVALSGAVRPSEANERSSPLMVTLATSLLGGPGGSTTASEPQAVASDAKARGVVSRDGNGILGSLNGGVNKVTSGPGKVVTSGGGVGPDSQSRIFAVGYQTIP